MGFFSKIKDNLSHGGIKVDLQAPASISMQDATLPVTITLTGGTEPHTVNRVTAEIQATSRNQSFSQPNQPAMAGSPNSAQTTTTTVARAENAQPFVIQPGEIKTIQLAIIVNGTQVIADQLPEGGAMAGVVGAFQKLQSVSQALNENSYTYTVEAKADVEGIALDPAKSQPLQMLRPGEIGGAVNL